MEDAPMDNDYISLDDLCRFMGISLEDFFSMDVSDLPEFTETEFPTAESCSFEPSNESVFVPIVQQGPDFKFVEPIVFLGEEGQPLSLSDTPCEFEMDASKGAKILFGDGGCIPFVIQKLIQPRGAPNKGKVKALLIEASNRAEMDITQCRKKHKTAYDTYCDSNGTISKDLLGNHKLETYSHPVVYQALKMSGKLMKKVKSHKVLNLLMPCSTVLVYGSLNMKFSCDQFPGFVCVSNETPENDHAILVHHGRIKCVNLIGADNKPITLASKKHLIIQDQGKTKACSYLESVRTAYIIE